MDLYTLLIEELRRVGFPISGAVDIDRVLNDPAQVFQAHIDRFDQWLEAGYDGAMSYLSRGRDRRADPLLVFPEAKSVVSVAIPYLTQPAGAPTPQEGPRYARYLQGRDYHLEIMEKLERAMEAVKCRWVPPLCESGTPLELRWKICTDTSAVLERTWAALCGLGWIGKNTLLIHPQLGSYLFLGEVLLNYSVDRGPSLLPSYCGNCTRCLNSCPTQAFPRAGELDANRGISYWTLEKRGSLDLSEGDRTKVGRWIAGCDVCQEVCPFNIKPTRLGARTLAESSDNATLKQHWVDLIKETPEEYKTRVKQSAMNRIKPAQFSRNLAITLANVLAERSELVNELRPLIEARIEAEHDSVARAEWERCRQAVQR